LFVTLLLLCLVLFLLFYLHLHTFLTLPCCIYVTFLGFPHILPVVTTTHCDLTLYTLPPPPFLLPTSQTPLIPDMDVVTSTIGSSFVRVPGRNRPDTVVALMDLVRFYRFHLPTTLHSLCEHTTLPYITTRLKKKFCVYVCVLNSFAIISFPIVALLLCHFVIILLVDVVVVVVVIVVLIVVIVIGLFVYCSHCSVLLLL